MPNVVWRVLVRALSYSILRSNVTTNNIIIIIHLLCCDNRLNAEQIGGQLRFGLAYSTLSSLAIKGIHVALWDYAYQSVSWGKNCRFLPFSPAADGYIFFWPTPSCFSLCCWHLHFLWRQFSLIYFKFKHSTTWIRDHVIRKPKSIIFGCVNKLIL